MLKLVRIAFLAVLTSPAFAADLSTNIDWGHSLYIEAVRGGCSSTNPLYRIRNASNGVAKHVLVCKETRQQGRYTREFLKRKMVPREVWELGCAVESGVVRQSFTIHYQDPQTEPPLNPEDAGTILYPFETGCSSSGCIWWLRNSHNFKGMTVTYTHRNQTRTEHIPPSESLLMIGPGTMPFVRRSVYSVPYRDNCLVPGDNYPNIPDVNP